MKTLVVLSVLVSLIIAAPMSQQKVLKVAGKEIARKTPEFVKREKKSPQQPEAFISLSPEGRSPGFETLPPSFNAGIASPTTSARSHFNVKGPIVVKKKSGYHVYRNSEEERAAADPQETCGKQMRVKLCNTHTTGIASDLSLPLNEPNVDVPNNDIESSIKVAKEAIESLQKNLLTLERNGQWKHGQSEMDSNMHHNIETVQHALQNMQGRIGKLESMNLRATTLKDSKVLDDLSKSKTEEERLAQWKEAMENIQKNVEVARNIEDSFKSGDDSLLTKAIDTTKLIRSNNPELKNSETSVKDSATSKRATEHKTEKNIGRDQHKSLKKRTSEKNDLEMTAAASELIKSTANHNKVAAEKSIDVHTSGLELSHKVKLEENKDQSADKHSSLRLNKDDHVHEFDKTEPNKEAALRTSEDKQKALNPANDLPIKKENAAKHEPNIKVWENSKSSHLLQEKTAWEEAQNQDTFMKMVDQTNTAKEANSQSRGEFGKLSLQDTVKMASNIQKHNTKHENSEFQMRKSEFTYNQGKHMEGHEAHIAEHEMQMKGHDMHMIGHDMHKGEKEMHKVGHELKMQGHGMHMADTHMYKGKLDMHKSGGEIHMPRHGMHMPEHVMYMPGHDMYMQGHKMHMQGHGAHIPGHEKHFLNSAGHSMKHGKHGKSSDLDTVMEPSHQMNVQDATGKSVMNELSQWKHHDSARASKTWKDGKHGKASDLDTVMEPSHQTNMQEATGKSEMDELIQWKHHDLARESKTWKDGKHEKASDLDSIMEPSHQMNVQEATGKSVMNELSQWKHHDSARASKTWKDGKHGKASDLDTVMEPSHQMNVQEATGKSVMNELSQWKHHDSARSGYGTGYAASGLPLVRPGGDALGIFPNAKVGGCGIPLLVSCSPSVVQGALAKSHSSYAAPAYKSEDDFGLKKKRDIVKSKDLLSSKIKKTKKNIEILETKN